MTFLCFLALVLVGGCKLRSLFHPRSRCRIFPNRGRVVGRIFLFLFPLRPAAKEYTKDFSHLDPAVLKDLGQLKQEEKMVVDAFPILFLDLPFGYSLAEGLQFLFINLEFRCPVAFLFVSTRLG